MTCIIGLVENGKVYMAGDSAGSAGNQTDIRTDNKVFKLGEFMVGFTSSYRMGQVIRHLFKPPKRKPRLSDTQYMVVQFVEALRACFKKYGVEPGNFIVGYKGKLFTIERDWQVAEQAKPFYSVGCGAREALAAMYVTDSLRMAPRTRLTLALEATAYYNNGVAAPFDVISQD